MKKFLKTFAIAIACFGAMNQFTPAEAIDIESGGYVQVECDVDQEPGESPNAMRRIAILEGYRYLAEQIGDLRISSNSTVSEYRLTNDEINVSVEKVVHGAQIVSVDKNSMGQYHVIVRLPVFGGETSLAATVLPKKSKEVKFPKPKYSNIESGNFDAKSYTGLIIDCRGMILQTAIAPSIESVDGSKIYSFDNVSRDTAVKRGIAAYSNSMDSGVQRAGSKPLVVKAVDTSGECDILISQEDADKILIANQQSNFLKNCMVVIVR